MGASPSKMPEQSPMIADPQKYEYQPEDWPWLWAIRHYIARQEERRDDDAPRELHRPELPVRIGEVQVDGKHRVTLFLGNAVCVRNMNKMKHYGITKVLNMAGPTTLPNKTLKAYQRHGIAYQQIHARDQHGYPLLKRHWQEAIEFLTCETSHRRNNNVVVNCVAGVNRSALIVTCFYMLQNRVTLLEAVQLLRQQRGNMALQTNESFQEQLVAFARIHGLLGAQPGTPECTLVSVAPPPPVPPPLRPYEERDENEDPALSSLFGNNEKKVQMSISDNNNKTAAFVTRRSNSTESPPCAGSSGGSWEAPSCNCVSQ